ncbi:hypothetical protein ACU686_40495 [Yinghuangia aomiensis]
MAESIFVRGEGGLVIEMALPLPEPIQDRLDKGALRRVHNDGSPYRDDEPTGPPAAGRPRRCGSGGRSARAPIRRPPRRPPSRT